MAMGSYDIGMTVKIPFLGAAGRDFAAASPTPAALAFTGRGSRAMAVCRAAAWTASRQVGARRGQQAALSLLP